MSHHIDVTDNTFESEVLQADKPVLLKFWAPWCGPCKIMAPVVDEVAEAREDALKVVNINVDDARQVAAEQGVRGVPTVMLFKDGQKIGSLIGAQSRKQLDEFIDQHI